MDRTTSYSVRWGGGRGNVGTYHRIEREKGAIGGPFRLAFVSRARPYLAIHFHGGLSRFLGEASIRSNISKGDLYIAVNVQRVADEHATLDNPSRVNLRPKDAYHVWRTIQRRCTCRYLLRKREREIRCALSSVVWERGGNVSRCYQTLPLDVPASLRSRERRDQVSDFRMRKID